MSSRFTEDQERESCALKGGEEGDPRDYTVEGLRPHFGPEEEKGKWKARLGL